MTDDIAAPENIEAPPDFRAIIKSELRDSGLATSDEVQEIAHRLKQVEDIIAALPTTYASAESVRKVTSAQADSQRKFTNIGTRLDELSSMKNRVDNMNDLLTQFVENQRERLTNQETTVTEVKKKTETLSTEVVSLKAKQETADQRHAKDVTPLRDFIVGSETHKPLMTVIDGLDSRLDNIQQQLTPAVDYIAEQKKKEADRVSFWRSVRLQIWTWRGVLSMLLALIVLLMIANSINFDQLFERIRQLAEAIRMLAGAVKTLIST